MSQLTPCPQCHTDRVWARAALGAYGISHVAFCPGCARAATVCTRCGTELVLARMSSGTSPARPVGRAVLQCPACRQEATASPGQLSAAAPGTSGGVAARSSAMTGPATVRRSGIGRLIAGLPAPAVMQRLADEREQLAAQRCLRRLQLIGLVGEAARRADAMARLDVELSRLHLPADC
ncbi:MAG TPA: hypothetical protein VN193_15000 [Candidatus Angelobacter sp.]|jgi:hypothetical protein|nr:hypothetical protein [Candidatus Angelobacter sp.]